MLPWVMEPRIAGGQEVTYGRSLGRYLKNFGQALSEWATLAQGRVGWRKLITERPFGVGKPRARPPRCDTRVSLEDIGPFMAQRAAEVTQRRAIFDAAVAIPTP